jgi:hypothetical protein
VNIAARRVQVLEDEEMKQELGEDVAKASAAATAG